MENKIEKTDINPENKEQKKLLLFGEAVKKIAFSCGVTNLVLVASIGENCVVELKGDVNRAYDISLRANDICRELVEFKVEEAQNLLSNSG